MEDRRTLNQLAAEAIQVQDAVNLSGLVYGWARSIKRLRELLPDVGTDAINQHPVNQLWADKVADLTRVNGVRDGTTGYADAYFECQRLAGREVANAAGG